MKADIGAVGPESKLKSRLRRSSRLPELTFQASATPCTPGQLRRVTVSLLPSRQAGPSAANLRGRYQRDVGGDAPNIISELAEPAELEFGADIHQRDSWRKALRALRNSIGLTVSHVLTVAL